MLSRRHCPHTGVVNFFERSEPVLSVGSVIRAGEPERYLWRYYLGRTSAVGIAGDMRTAENHLINSHRNYLREPGEAAGEAPVVRRNDGGDKIAKSA